MTKALFANVVSSSLQFVRPTSMLNKPALRASAVRDFICCRASTALSLITMVQSLIFLFEPRSDKLGWNLSKLPTICRDPLLDGDYTFSVSICN